MIVLLVTARAFSLAAASVAINRTTLALSSHIVTEISYRTGSQTQAIKRQEEITSTHSTEGA